MGIGDNIKNELDKESGQTKQFSKSLEQASTEVLRAMGQGREIIYGLKQAMSETLTDVIRIGGELSNIRTIQEQSVKTLGRNVILNSEIYKDLYAATKVTGSEVSTILSSFKNIGVSVYNAASGVQKIVDTARQMGVNTVEVTNKVLSNMDSLNKYNFQGGVEGLSKMAAQATSLRIDMKTTLDFANKVYDPEGAISTAAALQRLGVTQSQLLDPLRLMDLSRNDPTELQNQLVQMTQQFVKLGESGNFEIAPGAKSQLREIEKALQLPYDQLTKMALGSAELQDKLKKITFPDIPDDMKKLVANLAEKGTSGRYEVTFYDETLKETVTKAVEDINEKDFKYLEKATKPKTLEDLAKDQLTFTEDIARNIRSIAARPKIAATTSSVVLEGIEAGRKSMDLVGEILSGEKLSTKNLRRGVDDTLQETFMKSIEEYIKENKTPDLTEMYKKIEDNFKKFLEEAKPEIRTRAENILDELEKSQNQWIQILKEGIDKYKKLDDFAYLPGIGTFRANPEDTFLGFTDLNREVEENIYNTVVNPLPKTAEQFVFENKQSMNQFTKEDIQSFVQNKNFNAKIEVAITGLQPDVNKKQLEDVLNSPIFVQNLISTLTNTNNNPLTRAT